MVQNSFELLWFGIGEEGVGILLVTFPSPLLTRTLQQSCAFLQLACISCTFSYLLIYSLEFCNRRAKFLETRVRCWKLAGVVRTV